MSLKVTFVVTNDKMRRTVPSHLQSFFVTSLYKFD